MLGNPLGGFSQGVSSVAFDSDLTLASHLACLLVGHSEHVVGLDSPVHATVPWDWLSELLDFLLGRHFLDAEELFGSAIDSLILLSLVLVLEHGFILILALSELLLLPLGVLGDVVAVESVHLGWWDGLKTRTDG